MDIKQIEQKLTATFHDIESEEDAEFFYFMLDDGHLISYGNDIVVNIVTASEVASDIGGLIGVCEETIIAAINAATIPQTKLGGKSACLKLPL